MERAPCWPGRPPPRPLPPHSDAAPADIREGYWLSLSPGFAVAHVLRDFPFGVEESKKPTFHALTFVDLLGEDRGLLSSAKSAATATN